MFFFLFANKSLILEIQAPHCNVAVFYPLDLLVFKDLKYLWEISIIWACIIDKNEKKIIFSRSFKKYFHEKKFGSKSIK